MLYESDALEVKTHESIVRVVENQPDSVFLKASLAKADISKYLELMELEDDRLARVVKEIAHYKCDIGPLLEMIRRHSAYRQEDVIVSV